VSLHLTKPIHVFTVSCRALSVCVAALLAGCGGSQPQLSVSPAGFASQPWSARQAYNILHKFGGAGDGWYPSAALINVKGTLYGTTAKGGSHNAGTVFSITKSGGETVLHSFGGRNDGVQPFAPLINVNGTLYGTASAGGAHEAGTVFSITPAGNEKVLYSFGTSILDGAVPYAGLIDVKGMLYGTTSQGGEYDVCLGRLSCGTVFSITTSGTERVLYSFGRQTDDGFYPVASLVQFHGALYGTTSQGGTYGRGTVFSVGTFGGGGVVYSFGANHFFDGTNPSSALVKVNGTLYGTTVNGGAYDDSGTVFSITKGGREKVIHSFNGSGGSWPYAGLSDVKGTLYGTTSQGGVNNVGTAFSITTRGKETVLHSFGDGSGKHPVAGLLELGGTLYGTTYGVTAHRSGNVFSLSP
jgi:uncharacterized repeat protein (TIGR03803 family)